ncbi:hypothetical protein LPB140_00510 [Sphingorhabdus lutea]|uniref:Molybdenum cofactor guanylyltransferase n=1 Tax=Sphingorhabdus lutea TaxID=1913578 RepID=A0A1L3J8Y1_9SPHN|nr:molybdenum cofactor guanylyltransferase [Sphingorhabdus lutea]APG61574.1 hypothetical protein LPB140_00510 [Sphingorhabdus lutea]
MNKKPIIAAILAGGKSVRMGEVDKAELLLNGRRLIDHMAQKIAKQADIVILSAPHDYGLNLPLICDDAPMVKGPAAGIFSLAKYVRLTHGDAECFYTIPVDAPLFPNNILEKLSCGGGNAVVQTQNGLHPTFAKWHVDHIINYMADMADMDAPRGIALHEICTAVSAQKIYFDDENNFTNINNMEDFNAVQAMMMAKKMLG